MKLLQTLQNAIVETDIHGQDAVVETLCIGAVGRFPVMIVGEPGQGKSWISRVFLESLFRQNEYRISSINEGTSIHELFGGQCLIDRDGKVSGCYDTDSSIWTFRGVSLDEILNGKDRVMSALNSIIIEWADLNARSSHLVSQTVPINMEILIGSTNVDPIEWSDGKPSAEAFIDRWLVHNIKAPTEFKIVDKIVNGKVHSDRISGLFNEEYMRTIMILRSQLNIVNWDEIKPLLREMLLGGEIQPRTAKWIIRAACARAILYQRSNVILDDLFKIIPLLPRNKNIDITSIIKRENSLGLQRLIEQKFETYGKYIAKFTSDFRVIKQSREDKKTKINNMVCILRQLGHLNSTISLETIPDSLYEIRKAMIENITCLQMEINDHIMQLADIEIIDFNISPT